MVEISNTANAATLSYNSEDRRGGYNTDDDEFTLPNDMNHYQPRNGVIYQVDV